MSITQNNSITMGPEVSILLEAYNALYIEIPKAACTSFKVAFAKLLGINLDSVGGNPHQFQYPSPNTHSFSGLLYPGLYSFAFVRNPWVRLVSCYRDKILGEVEGFTYFTERPGVANCLAHYDVFFPNMSFEDFVKAVASIPDTNADAHFRSQYTFICNQENEIAIDFVGRYEKLTDDFCLIQRRIGLPSIKLPHLQTTKRPIKYTDYYSLTTQQIVAERFSRDVELFQYSFET